MPEAPNVRFSRYISLFAVNRRVLWQGICSSPTCTILYISSESSIEINKNCREVWKSWQHDKIWCFPKLLRLQCWRSLTPLWSLRSLSMGAPPHIWLIWNFKVTLGFNVLLRRVFLLENISLYSSWLQSAIRIEVHCRTGIWRLVPQTKNYASMWSGAKPSSYVQD